MGDGDQALEACGSYINTSGAESFGCEVAFFWTDLSAAHLIEGNYASALDAMTEVPEGEQSSYFPPAALGNGNYLAVFHARAGLAGWSCIYTGTCLVLRQINRVFAGGNYSVDDRGITPVQAYNIDNKMDDGTPNTGKNCWW